MRSNRAVEGRGHADRVATLDQLRERMATVPSRIGSSEAGRAAAEDVIAVAGPLGELMPGGGLPRGRVVGCPRGSVLCALVAAATVAGLHTAIVGGLRSSRINVLAAVEMGARLDRLAMIEGGERAAEVLGVLADGVPVLVLDDPQVRLRPQQVEALRGRIRDKDAVLITTTDLGARQPHLDIAVTHIADHGLGQGRGRVHGWDLDVRVSRQGHLYRRGRIALVGRPGGGTHWSDSAQEREQSAGPGLAITG